MSGGSSWGSYPVEGAVNYRVDEAPSGGCKRRGLDDGAEGDGGGGGR